MTKAVTLREKSEQDLIETIHTLRKERLNLRMQRSQGNDVSTHRFGEIRRDIARIMTILTEKKGDK